MKAGILEHGINESESSSDSGDTHFLDSDVCFHNNALIGRFLGVIMAEGTSWKRDWFHVAGFAVQTHQVRRPTHVP
jgi:hypothetical protein